MTVRIDIWRGHSLVAVYYDTALCIIDAVPYNKRTMSLKVASDVALLVCLIMQQSVQRTDHSLFEE